MRKDERKSILLQLLSPYVEPIFLCVGHDDDFSISFPVWYLGYAEVVILVPKPCRGRRRGLQRRSRLVGYGLVPRFDLSRRSSDWSFLDQTHGRGGSDRHVYCIWRLARILLLFGTFGVQFVLWSIRHVWQCKSCLDVIVSIVLSRYLVDWKVLFGNLAARIGVPWCVTQRCLVSHNNDNGR